VDEEITILFDSGHEVERVHSAQPTVH
jgi:hypothetical protein